MAIVYYYSWSGRTRICAAEAASVLGADLVELREKRPRKLGFLGFFRAGYEASAGKMTDIEPLEPTADELLVLAFPIWAGKLPPAVNSALRQLDFKGKSVLLLSTLGDAKPYSCYSVVRQQVEAQGGTVKDSLQILSRGDLETFQGRVASSIRSWLEPYRK